jgi:exodeoxyribonuclease VII large subunit
MLIRGGGSLEDLMPFNDELLARCIYESKLPVITGIGHQPDTTIADYVADVSMETPTAAAVHISPDKFELIQKIDDMENHIKNYINFRMNNLTNDLLENKNKLKIYNPEATINKMSIEFKNANNSILKIMNYKLKEIKYLKQAHVTIKQTYLSYFSKYKLFNNELIKTMQTYFIEKTSTIKTKTNELISCNPKKILKKGYSIIRDSNKKIIKNKEIFKKLKEFNVEFHDGLVKLNKK